MHFTSCFKLSAARAVVPVISSALTLAMLPHNPVAAEPIYVLDEITVTAKRFRQPQMVQPAQVRVIDREEIRSSGALTLPDILRRGTGLTVRSLNGGATSSISLDARGYGEGGSSHVLVLLDGRRLNAPDTNGVDFWSAIPLSRVERIEIQQGSGTVLYGDNAVGAVVNIITGGDWTQAGAEFRTGSFGTRQLGAHAGFTQDRLRSRMDVNLERSEGYRQHSANRNASLGGRIEADQGSGQLFLDFGAGVQDAELPGYLTREQARSNPKVSEAGNGQGDSDRSTWHIRPGIRLKAAKGLIFQAELGHEYNRLDSRLTYDMGGFLATSQVDNTYRTWSLTPRFNLEHRLFGLAADTVLGLDLYHTDFASSREYFGTTRLDLEQSSRAVYGQSSLTLGPATTLTAGLRRQQVDQQASRTDSVDLDNDQSRNAWDLGISHSIRSGPRVFARHGRVFRFARADELTTFTGLGVPLRPERGYSTDLGLDWAGGPVRLQATLYRQDLEDEIAYNPDPDGDPNTWDGRNENLLGTRHTGLTVEGRYAITERLTLNGGYALTEAEFVEGPDLGKTLPLVPRHSARLGLVWQAAPDWRLDGSLNWTGSRYYGSDTDNSSPKLPGYATLDLNATWQQGPWQVRLAGRNLTDAAHADTGFEYLLSQYPADGRAVFVSVAYTP